MADLPEPKHDTMGYTWPEMLDILGHDEGSISRFDKWMEGQTAALDPEHGVIYYRWDVARFCDRLPVID